MATLLKVAVVPIFFDEIQDFPEIATCFKSFAQQGKYDVISSGSLLGIQLKRIESISVGFQEKATMRSLDFEEFLTACGYKTEQLDELYGHLLDGRPFGEAANATFDRLFLDYTTLGGMPEVVERYFVKGTFEGVPAIQRRIVSDYRSDVRKYAEGLDAERIVNVFDSIPGQLAKENKKFQLSHVAKNARYKDYWGCVAGCQQQQSCPHHRIPWTVSFRPLIGRHNRSIRPVSDSSAETDLWFFIALHAPRQNCRDA